VGAERGANIITAIGALFGEIQFRRTLENFSRHCNYLSSYEIQASRNFNISEYRSYEHQKISYIRNPGMYSWAVGIK
jgi:hypothetical protein